MNKKLLILVLFSNVASAMWSHESQIGSSPRENFFSKEQCEAKLGPECFDTSGIDLDASSVQTVQEDDPSQPQYSAPSKEEACADAQACAAQMLPDDYCAPGELKFYGDRDSDGNMETWCTSLTGYAQMNVKRLLPDAGRATTKAAADAVLAGKARVKKRMAFGQDIMAELAVRNVQKGLSIGQRRTVRQDLSDVMSALQAGALEDARELVVALVVDGARLTQADKDWALAAIDAYLAAE